MRTGDISWHELLTDDVEAAKTFYENMFGWTYSERGDSTEYWVFNDGQKDAGGIMKRPEGTPAHSAWTVYVTVDDVNATIAQVRSLGGKVPAGPVELDDVGRFAVVEDPQGAFIHVIEYDDAAESSGNAGIQNPTGEPEAGQFCWYTLMTTDVSRAKNFYESVFDWKLVEAPDGGGSEAWTVTNDGAPIAGLMASQGSGEQPPAWGVSITVDDVEAAAAQVKQHGGHVVIEPTSAGKIGRHAIVADTAGSMLALFEANMEEMDKMMKKFSG